MGLFFSVPEKKSVSEKCIPEKKFTLKYCTENLGKSRFLFFYDISEKKDIQHKDC